MRMVMGLAMRMAMQMARRNAMFTEKAHGNVIEKSTNNVHGDIHTRSPMALMSVINIVNTLEIAQTMVVAMAKRKGSKLTVIVAYHRRRHDTYNRQQIRTHINANINENINMYIIA